MSEDKISSQMERILEIRRQLEALLPKEGLDREELVEKLASIEYEYDEERNQFV